MIWKWLCIAAACVAVSIGAMLMSARTADGFMVWSDGVAYFIYARSLVVDGDLDATNEYRELDRRLPTESKVLGPLRRWSTQHDDGRVGLPWPAGTAVLLAPAYAIGLAAEAGIARLQGREADSYGAIPQMFFSLGSVIWAVAGAALLYALCLQIVDSRRAWLAVGATLLCGPMLFYALFNPSMAHAVSFSLVTAMTYLWMRAWNEGSTGARMALIGALLGAAATVRYQNALFALLPVCLVLRDWQRSGFSAAARGAAIGMVATAIPVVMLLSGHLNVRTVAGGTVVAASYPVDLTSPFFFDVLFSCRHGAFHWAPVLGVGAIGLIWAVLRGAGWVVPLLGSVLLQAYLIGGLGLATQSEVAESADWINHWSGAPSFGMRYLAECAPMFAVGLAVLMRDTVWRFASAAWLAALAPFAAWNALLVVAYGLGTITRSGCLPYEQMWVGGLEAIRMIFAF